MSAPITKKEIARYKKQVLQEERSVFKDELYKPGSGVLVKVSDDIKTCDDWMDDFMFYSNDFPASIVISDMHIEGYPMIFVNKCFTSVSGFSKEESIGRNCRFLQGPKTEPESIETIRNALTSGTTCHVKITNYRKNGETFLNLLTLKPVYDADDEFRYTIGVQFEVTTDDIVALKRKSDQLGVLVQKLPSKLNLPSKHNIKEKCVEEENNNEPLDSFFEGFEEDLNEGSLRERIPRVNSSGKPLQS